MGNTLCILYSKETVLTSENTGDILNTGLEGESGRE